jgi:hypothetical protein
MTGQKILRYVLVLFGSIVIAGFLLVVAGFSVVPWVNMFNIGFSLIQFGGVGVLVTAALAVWRYRGHRDGSGPPLA